MVIKVLGRMGKDTESEMLVCTYDRYKYKLGCYV